MLANAIALSIVAVAAVYAVWKLMPVAARQRIAAASSRIAQRRAGISSQRAATFELRLVGKACGACDSCGGCNSQRLDPTRPTTMAR